jgi:hypothetical protein
MKCSLDAGRDTLPVARHRPPIDVDTVGTQTTRLVLPVVDAFFSMEPVPQYLVDSVNTSVVLVEADFQPTAGLLSTHDPEDDDTTDASDSLK